MEKTETEIAICLRTKGQNAQKAGKKSCADSQSQSKTTTSKILVIKEEIFSRVRVKSEISEPLQPFNHHLESEMSIKQDTPPDGTQVHSGEFREETMCRTTTGL